MLTEKDRAKVQQTVERIEQETAGELVVVHAARSSDYALLRSIGSLGLTVVLAWEALVRLGPDSHPLVVMAQVPAFFLLYGMLGWPPLLRMIVRKPIRQREVMAKAMHAFLAEGVTETRDRSGVLIFLSEAERQVVILADKGINDRVPAEEWRTDVDALASAIKAGRAGEGLVQTIERIGGLLRDAFPARADDKNELSDAVRVIQ